MTTTEPPELPATAPTPDKPIWKWALALTGAYSLYAFVLSDQSQETSYRVGYAMGNGILPILGAWIAALIHRRAHTPTVVAGVLIALMLIGNGTTYRAIRRITAEYTADFETSIHAWSKRSAAWEASGGCDINIITDQDKLRRNLALAFDAKESCESLLAELESGADYLQRLADEGIDSSDANAAWASYRTQGEFDTVLATIQATDTMLRTVTLYLSEMDDKFGRWQVDANDMIMFDEDVDDKIVERVNQQLASLRTQSAALVEMAENHKRLKQEAR